MLIQVQLYLLKVSQNTHTKILLSLLKGSQFNGRKNKNKNGFFPTCQCTQKRSPSKVSQFQIYTKDKHVPLIGRTIEKKVRGEHAKTG